MKTISCRALIRVSICKMAFFSEKKSTAYQIVTTILAVAAAFADF